MRRSIRLSRRAVVMGLAGVALATPAGAQGASYSVRGLGPVQAAEDVALMRRALEMIHPGLYRRASQRTLTRAFARLEEAARTPLDELGLYRGISAVLADIRCSHTKAEQPPGFEEWRQANPSHLPFRFRMLEGRMIVVSAASSSGLTRGAEILSIDGRSIRSMTRALGRYVAMDGNTHWCRAELLADDGDLMGSDFDHFYPYVFGRQDMFEIAVREPGATGQRRLTLPAISFRDWQTLDNEGRAYRSNFADTTTWRMLDAATGYLRIETFVNYRRPANGQALIAQAMTELREGGAERLILDLRDNGGGSDDAALALLDHLALRPYTYQRAIRLRAVRYGDLTQYIETWGDRDALFNPPLERFVQSEDGWFDRRAEDYPDVLQERRPAPAAFQGPVTVLTSPVNASGATMVISKLKDEGRVRLVGGRCGGSGDGPTAGQILNLRLPNSGIVVRIPLAFNQMNVNRFDVDGGIRPDLLVAQRVEDFRAGFDRVRHTALTLR
jgi:Peptidase family S41